MATALYRIWSVRNDGEVQATVRIQRGVESHATEGTVQLLWALEFWHRNAHGRALTPHDAALK